MPKSFEICPRNRVFVWTLTLPDQGLKSGHQSQLLPMFWDLFLDEVFGISRRIKISHFKEFWQKNVISFSSPMFYFSHFLLFLHTLRNLGHRNAIEMKSQVQTLNIETVFFQDVKVKFSSNFWNKNLVLQQQNIFWINLEKKDKM